MLNAATTSAIATIIASSSSKSQGAKHYEKIDIAKYVGGDFVKIVGVIVIGVFCLYIIRSVIDIVKTVKERKRAREPDTENGGKEDNDDVGSAS